MESGSCPVFSANIEIFLDVVSLLLQKLDQTWERNLMEEFCPDMANMKVRFFPFLPFLRDFV